MSKLSDYKKVFKGDVIKNESRILTFIPTPKSLIKKIAVSDKNKLIIPKSL